MSGGVRTVAVILIAAVLGIAGILIGTQGGSEVLGGVLLAAALVVLLFSRAPFLGTGDGGD